MNRQARRQLAANADTLSVLMAATCLGYAPGKATALVRNARAVQVLQAAFAKMMRGGGEPQVVQIAKEVADAFPLQRKGDVDFADLAKAWLAVGIDREGRGTYAMRRLVIRGVSPTEERDIAEVAMLGELARELNMPGFPISTSSRRA